MILIFEASPKLVTQYKMDPVKMGQVNQFKEKFVDIASPGILAARIFRQHDAKPLLLAPIGGKIGQKIKKIAKAEGLGLVDIDFRDESMEEVRLGLEDPLILQSKPTRATQEEFNRLFSTLTSYQEEVKNFLLLGGTEAIEEKYPYLIKRSHDLAYPVFVCLNGRIQDCVKERPFNLVCSKDQLEDYSGLKCNFSHEVIQAGKMVLAAGVKGLFIGGRGKTSIYMRDHSYWTIQSKDLTRQDLTLVTIGLSGAYEKKYDLEMTLKFARALGAFDSQSVDKIDLADLKQRMKDLSIKEGKFE
ncbi:hexose kinase, 1-phosphofructokinase family [Urinicoccus massiliensis]|uniref:Hexose kinase, 1-phosphofructokinase family n=1 Tax=Urinicoccus massiliensis TaxID=1723382 RepID=A0A8H2M584_9FIRM|nr:hypothetical protein [Urinicoccus massiliensis]VFB16163.1 hexose kinase, 1-phosphofructokinase family [Urinicoccus massiliensis]